MATRMSDILGRARSRLQEYSPRAWSDEELLDHANDGIKDLWRRIVDLYQHHFVTIDETNVFLPANEPALAGIPDDVAGIVSIEPRVVGASSAALGLVFKPANGYNDPRFVQARAQAAITPERNVIWYVVMNPGAPVGPPVIRCAPQVTVDLDLALVYNHTLERVDEDDDNPIPGETDNALVCWIVAYARAIERDDRAPDPEWLALYGTEKTNAVTSLTPRQTQEPTVAMGMFGEDDDTGWGW